jgi:hypothetical protein
MFNCEAEIKDGKGRVFSASGQGMCRPRDVRLDVPSGGPNRLAELYGISAGPLA